MSSDIEVIERLRRAGDALPLDVPDHHVAARRGRGRLVMRRTAAVAASLVVAGGLAWAVAGLSGLGGKGGPPTNGAAFDPSQARQVKVPWSAETVPIPEGWTAEWVRSRHAVAFLASTAEPGPQEALPGCPEDPSCSIGPRPPDAVSRTDAFVHVFAAAPSPCSSCPLERPLPGAVSLGDFRPGREILGVPTIELRGRGRDGREYAVTYWVGPDALSDVQAGAEYLVEHLHLPTIAPPDWVTYVDAERGLQINYPPTWVRAPIDTTTTAPVPLIELATFSRVEGNGGCTRIPGMAPGDALVSILELTRGQAFGPNGRPLFSDPRPPRFDPTDIRPELSKCFPTTPPGLNGYIHFTESGRFFSIYVALGPDISPEITDEAMRILDSLWIEPGSPPSEA